MSEQQPTIHEQAFWDAELDELAEAYEPFDGVALNRMDETQRAEFIAFVWKGVLRNRELLKELALEAPKKRAPRARAEVSEQ